MTMSVMADPRDRTREFLSAISALKRGVQNRHKPPVSTPGDAQVGSGAMKSFLQDAAHIDKGVQMALARVREVKSLSSRRTVFDDGEDKINELRHIIKQDFGGLSKDIERLQERANTDRLIVSKSHTRSHAHAVVQGLRQKVAQATKDFATILSNQNRLLQQETSRRSRFETSGSSVAHLRMRRRAVDGFWKRKNEKTHSEQIRLQQLQQQETEMKYLDRRASAIRNIESTLTELGGMYSKMANIVATQQEIAISIDENMTSTLEQTEMGHNELVKYFTAVSGNRGLIIKIFVILIALTLLFTYLKVRG